MPSDARRNEECEKRRACKRISVATSTDTVISLPWNVNERAICTIQRAHWVSHECTAFWAAVHVSVEANPFVQNSKSVFIRIKRERFCTKEFVLL